MKLLTYFNNQKAHKLSDKAKLTLFHQIQKKKNISPNSGLLKRALFHKKIWYSALTLGIIFVFFGTYFRDTIETTNYRAFFSHKIPNSNTVQADQIAKILDINWEYFIEKDGKQFHNSVLFDGDLITLKPNAKVVFSIDESTKIEVQWPAQFSISNKLQSGYLLKLIDGNFLKITAEKSEKNLTIETDKLNLETPHSQKINLEISKVNNQLQLKNQWAALLMITKGENQTQIQKTLPAEKIITMQENDITKIEDIKTFSQSLIAGNLTHTSKLSNINTGLNTEEILTSGISNTKPESSEIASVISNDLTTSLDLQIEEWDLNKELLNSIQHEEDKKIPTEDQLSLISAALSSSFLKEDMQNRYLALYNDDQASSEHSIRLLSLKLQNIGKSFGIEIKQSTSPSELWESINHLLTELGSYHLPPSKLGQLKKLKNWINFLRQTPKQNWEEFSITMPSNLKF